MSGDDQDRLTLTVGALGMVTFATAGVLCFLRLVTAQVFLCAAGAGLALYGYALIAGGDRSVGR